MEGLKTRGVRGVEFVVSDDHAGLKRAVRELLPEAVWQRCYVHFLRNALDYLPRKADDDCRQELRWLYDRRNLKEAQQDLKAWLTRWATRDPKLTDWVEAHIGETLTFYSLPRQHHKHLKSTNMLKRLNEEDQAADAAEDGALVSPFTGLPVQGDDPFTVGGLGLAVRGGPVCMASWEDAAPWLAKMARASAEHLDALSKSHRHTRVLKDARRLASVQLGYNEPLFGVTAADDRYTLPHTIPAGWDRLWSAVHAVQAVFVTIDPINLAAVWSGYGPTEVGAFLGAVRDELGGRAGALLVGHTGKAAAKADEPSAIDILGSGAWSARARCAFVARSVSGHYELHLVKANYAPIRHAWAYKATPTGALALVDIRVEQHEEHAEIDAKVLAHIQRAPYTASALTKKVFGYKGKGSKSKIDDALGRLREAGHVNVIVNEKGDLWSTSENKG